MYSISLSIFLSLSIYIYIYIHIYIYIRLHKRLPPRTRSDERPEGAPCAHEKGMSVTVSLRNFMFVFAS